MAIRVDPGSAVTLGGNVVDSTTLLPKTSGTIYALVQLSFNGDADDGKYWDTNAGGSWQTAASVVTWPTATYSHGNWWAYEVPTGATTGKDGATIKLVHLTDNEATPASETTLAGGLETAEVSSVSRVDLSTDINTLLGNAGISSVTITIQDGVPVAVPGVAVAIYNAANTTFITSGTTDSNGQVAVNLNDATYSVRLAKAGYTFTVPETLVVSGTTTDTYTAAAWAPTAPSGPDLCVVFGWLTYATSTAIVGAVVEAFAVVPTTAGGYQLVENPVSDTTDATGYFELELLQGASVKIVCAEAGLDTSLTVPAASSQNITTWS